MRRVVFLFLTVMGVGGCLVMSHLRKDIPPPGGCDQCHRQKISGDWVVTLAPAQLGREGGIPEDVDIVLQEIRQIPYHREVPAKRLTVFAAAVPREVVGDEETGVQCFVCHRSPGPPHETARGSFGKFPHPWGKGATGGEPSTQE